MQIIGEKGMNGFKNLMKRFMSEEDGQTTTEYILLLAIVAFIIMRLKGQMETRLKGLIDGAFDRADRELTTGG